MDADICGKINQEHGEQMQCQDDAILVVPSIEIVPNHSEQIALLNTLQSFSIGQPNDPLYSQQWGMLSTKWDSIWQEYSDSNPRETVVAVIDTGIDFTHPDLINSVWTNPDEIPGDGIDNDGNGYVDDVHGWNFVSKNNNPTDDHGHGTHVSGIIGAQIQNGIGVAGVAKNVKIMPIKVLNAYGRGSISNIIAAIDYSLRKGVHISCNSYGGAVSLPLAQAALAAGRLGQLLVVAAGNEGSASPLSPCADSGICVGSVQLGDEGVETISPFSNWGPHVHVAAPGAYILSTYPVAKGSYVRMSGTSMAAPFVAGLAAMILGSNTKSLSVSDIRNLIINNVVKYPGLHDKVSTSGVLDISATFASSRSTGEEGEVSTAGTPIPSFSIKSSNVSWILSIVLIILAFN
jgi:subtilisin family serine protease